VGVSAFVLVHVCIHTRRELAVVRGSCARQQYSGERARFGENVRGTRQRGRNREKERERERKREKDREWQQKSLLKCGTS